MSSKIEEFMYKTNNTMLNAEKKSIYQLIFKQINKRVILEEE